MEKLSNFIRSTVSTLSAYHPRLQLRNASVYQNWRRKEKAPKNIEYYYTDRSQYSIHAETGGFVKEASLEAARISLARKTKNKSIYKIPAPVPITKKAEGSRMGKGKGKVAYYAAIVKPGKIVLGFECDNDTLAWEAFIQASRKLPIRTHLRIKPRQERRILSVDELCFVAGGNKLPSKFEPEIELHQEDLDKFMS